MSTDKPRQEKNESDLPVRRTRGAHRTPSSSLRFRSPAVESVELPSASSKREKDAVHSLIRKRAERAGRSHRVSYAAEGVLAAPVVKSLPPLRSKVARAGIPETVMSISRRTGSLTNIVDLPRRSSVPLQVISEEEQKKLAALEMQLPRMAGKADSILLVVILALLCVGLVMVYSASSFVSARYYADASYFFQKQLLGAVLGVVVMFMMMRIDYRVWRRFSLAGMLVALPLLVIVLKFGTSAYGASRWLAFGSFFSFQPSELIKLVLALYIADWLARKGSQVGTFLYGLAPFAILVGLILGLILLENDMGTASVIAALTMAMFFTAGANIWQFLLTMSGGILIFVIQAFQGYRFKRLIGFIDPFKHTTDLNLQLYQSLLALGSGGWLGLGLGASRQKTGYLPLPYIDSIFAIIGEELGYIGCFIIVVLFMILAFRGFRVARRTQDVYGALLATGITTWLVVQAMINIGSTVGAIPYTGVPLPFISFGGTSLVISLAAVGVLLSISRYTREPDDPALSRETISKKFRRKVAE